MDHSAFVRSLLLSLFVLLLAVPGASAFGRLGGVNMVAGGPDEANFQLDSPSKLARLGDSSFFVLDTGNSRMLRIGSDGELLYEFGGSGGGSSSLTGASTFAVVGGGSEPDLLVGFGNGKIRRYKSDGTYVSTFGGYGTTPGLFASIGGMAVDPSCGELFVGDAATGVHRVQRIAIEDNPVTPGVETEGQALETIGQGVGYPTDWQVDGKVMSPKELAFADGARLFVVDNGNRRIQTFNWSGSCASRSFAYEDKFGSNTTSQPDATGNPNGIAIDRTVTPTRIFVTNTYIDHTVKMFSATSPWAGAAAPPFTIPVSGRVWGPTFPYPDAPTERTDDLGEPVSLAVDGGSAWVLERANNRIHRYSGLSDLVPFVAPTTDGFWGEDSRDDGYLQDAGPIAATASGGAVVVDSRKCRIQRFSVTGSLLGAFGSCDYGAGTPSDGVFGYAPSGIAINTDGEILLSDWQSGRIQRFSSSGTHLSNITWPATGAQTIAPGPIDVDPLDNIWVYDYNNCDIVKLSPAGNVLASFGSCGTGESDDSLFGVGDLVASDDGLELWVLDRDASRIKKFTSTDGVAYTPTTASSANLSGGSGDGQLKTPNAIELDPAGGQLIVADTQNHRVQRLSASDYSFVSKFGSYGLGAAGFDQPRGVAGDSWGNLWVADSGNDSLKRFGEAPVVTLGALPATTLAASIGVTYESSDPAASCDFVSGDSLDLQYGINAIAVSCTNSEGTGVGTFNLTRLHQAPLVAITAPSSTSTTASALNVTYTVDGGASIPDATTCTVNGAASSDAQNNSLALALGANTITVACQNDGGADAKTVSITRWAPGLKFPKKLKLSRSRTLSFSVTCADDCTVTGRLKGSKIKWAPRSVLKLGASSPQKVTLKLSKKLAVKVRAALAKKKRVTLSVTVAAKGAKQGKTGSAILKK
jgi:sugar lactone lactonase YvrE